MDQMQYYYPMETRTAEARKAMSRRGLDALVVTSDESIRYLSGFTGGDSVSVLGPGCNMLITDGRYIVQAAVQAPGWEICQHSGNLFKVLAEAVSSAPVTGLDSDVSHTFYTRLSSLVAPPARLVPDAGIVERLRYFKDPGEVNLIKRACACASSAFNSIIDLIRPGISERELASRLDCRMMEEGAQGPAFDTIVASGPNAAMPHAEPTGRTLAAGDLVMIDFGARVEGYCCDITRTLVAGGPPDRRQLEVIGAVYRARELALSMIRPGIATGDLEVAARRLMEEKGLAAGIRHSLGHGVGLSVHERPSLSRLSEEVVAEGMVLTVEPGAYFEGWGGVRLEETVLVTGSGSEILTDGASNPWKDTAWPAG